MRDQVGRDGTGASSEHRQPLSLRRPLLPATCGRGWALGGLVLLVGAIMLPGCTGSTLTLPKPNCPTQPTVWKIGSGSNQVTLNPADYPIAPRSEQTSIAINLSERYIQHRIKSTLEEPSPDNPHPDSGMFVNSSF
jgi:hypothetical protein